MRRPAPAPKQRHFPPWLDRAARVLLTLYTTLLLLPFRFHAAATGLDSSWAVALNLLHVQGAIHGRDIAFTYGPLSYLALPMPMGTNLEQALIFQALSWVVLAGLLTWFALRVPLPWLLLFAVVAVPGSVLLHNFGYAGPVFFWRSSPFCRWRHARPADPSASLPSPSASRICLCSSS